MRNRKDELLNWLTVALFAGPILLDMGINGWKRSFFYFAADAFYYFTVAQNFAVKGFFTFDQQFPTNGFHPLWQFLLALLYRVAKALSLSQPVILTSTILINVAFISVAIWLLGRCFIDTTHRLPTAFLVLPVGLHGLLISPIYDRYNSLWSYANGMESALVIFLYAVFMRFTVRPGFLETSSSAILTSLLLSLLFLARLDHGLFAVALILLVAVESIILQDRKKLSASLLTGGGCAIVLIVYFLINLHTVGMLLPVSGTLKSSFPTPDLQKIPESLHLVKHLLSRLVRLDLSLSWGYKEIAYRHAQILVPIFAAIGYLTQYIARSRRTFYHFEQIDLGLAATSVFVLLLGSYNYFCVPIWGQGHWYFPVSVLFVSLLTVRVCLEMTARFFIRFLGWFTNRVILLTLMIGGIIIAILSLGADLTGLGGQAGIGEKQVLGALLGLALLLVGSLGSLLRQPEKGTVIIAAIMAMGVLSFFQLVYRNDVYNQHYATFFDHAASFQEYYTQKNEDPKLIEFDDGIIAYSTGYPTMSGLGFALDKQAAEHKIGESLLSLAYQRGYTRITSLVYFHTFDFSTISYATPSDVLKSQLGKTFFLC